MCFGRVLETSRNTGACSWPRYFQRGRDWKTVPYSSILPGEFPADAEPVPPALMIAASAEQVKEDAAEAGLCDVGLHGGLMNWPLAARTMYLPGVRGHRDKPCSR